VTHTVKQSSKLHLLQLINQ